MGNTASACRDTRGIIQQLVFKDSSTHINFQVLEQKFLGYDVWFELQSLQIMRSLVM